MANKNLANCKQVHHPCEKVWANNWVLRIYSLKNGLVALATLWISGAPGAPVDLCISWCVLLELDTKIWGPPLGPKTCLTGKGDSFLSVDQWCWRKWEATLINMDECSLPCRHCRNRAANTARSVLVWQKKTIKEKSCEASERYHFDVDLQDRSVIWGSPASTPLANRRGNVTYFASICGEQDYNLLPQVLLGYCQTVFRSYDGGERRSGRLAAGIRTSSWGC